MRISYPNNWRLRWVEWNKMRNWEKRISSLNSDIMLFACESRQAVSQCKTKQFCYWQPMLPIRTVKCHAVRWKQIQKYIHSDHTRTHIRNPQCHSLIWVFKTSERRNIWYLFSFGFAFWHRYSSANWSCNEFLAWRRRRIYIDEVKGAQLQSTIT